LRPIVGSDSRNWSTGCNRSRTEVHPSIE
jgi:hypothetical protein